MEGFYKEIYNRLSYIDKLNKRMYHELVSAYGKEAVHSVIEAMIEENENNIFKFDYYVDLVIANVGSGSFKNILDIYMNDVGRTRRLTSTENIEYSKEAYEIVNELKSIFSTFDCEYVKTKTGVIFNSIVDEVEFYLEECKDQDVINRLKELNDRYIEVRNKLVEGNLRVVVAAAKPFFRDDVSFLEIIQYGNIGLMRAVEKYDPSFDTLFVTYGYYWIKQGLRAAVKAEFTTATSVSYYAIERNNMRLKTINVLSNELGREPTDNEIALYMGISSKKLEEIENTFSEKISLDSPVSEFSPDSSRELTFIDTIRDENIDIENDVCTKIFCDQLMEMLKENLNEKQMQVLMYRYGFHGESLTAQKIADIIGVSRQRVQQLEKSALIRAKRFVAKNNIKVGDNNGRYI